MIRQITLEEKNRCLKFATEIIKGGNQFNRFNQNQITQINRTYVGKLAEYVFLHFLNDNGIEYSEGDMFEIFEGQENADTYDFVTGNGKSIDIKTASLPFHKRIMIPISQFHLSKDYYVGIKLNFKNTSGRNINPMDIDSCQICGYIERSVMENQPTQYFGEGNCKAYSLNNLKPINDLLKLFNQ
jgi:hypothetical protein